MAFGVPPPQWTWVNFLFDSIFLETNSISLINASIYLSKNGFVNPVSVVHPQKWQIWGQKGIWIYTDILSGDSLFDKISFST